LLALLAQLADPALSFRMPSHGRPQSGKRELPSGMAVQLDRDQADEAIERLRRQHFIGIS
jgi:hypothetical protein